MVFGVSMMCSLGGGGGGGFNNLFEKLICPGGSRFTFLRGRLRSDRMFLGFAIITNI
jgi:hypothetical protein